MKAGDAIRCLGSRGYSLTAGEVYTVVEYQPECRDFNYTWPAYVRVLDDNGKSCWCHASRFTVEG